jgi:indole-3-glycerol phosphate synthase
MTFLDKIITAKREGVSRQLRGNDIDVMREMAKRRRKSTKAHRFRDALSRSDRTNIVAEIKRASPSKGAINDRINVDSIAKDYASGGAAAISVLTEPDYFKGSLEDMRDVRAAVGLPILRKDFIVDEFQIYESAAFGADAILLIVAALTDDELERLLLVAREELHMDAIVEAHTPDELTRGEFVGADIIGVNNRDLYSLDVSLDTSRELIKLRPPEVLMIAESGITNRDELDELRGLGYDGFLIGESLMRATDTVGKLRELIK